MPTKRYVVELMRRKREKRDASSNAGVFPSVERSLQDRVERFLHQRCGGGRRVIRKRLP